MTNSTPGVDHTLRDADHLFAHAGYERIVFSKPPPLGVAGGCCNGIGSHIKTRYQNYAVGETHTFSSNLLNDARFAYIRFGVGTLGYNSGKNISEEAGIPNANRGDSITSGLSLFNLSGYGFANSMGGPTYVPELVADNTYQVADSVILIKGRHSIKFGVDFRRMQRNFYQSQAPVGQFTYRTIHAESGLREDGKPAESSLRVLAKPTPLFSLTIQPTRVPVDRGRIVSTTLRTSHLTLPASRHLVAAEESRRSPASTIRLLSRSRAWLLGKPLPINLAIQAMECCADRTR
jgi:hypothetical protein